MLCVVAFRIKIVGNKTLASSGQFLLLDHGMAAVNDLQIGDLKVGAARLSALAVGVSACPTACSTCSNFGRQ